MAHTQVVPVPLARREASMAIGYFAAYFAYLFASLESDLMHWLGLVALPLLVAIVFRPPGARTVRDVMATFGLRKGNLTTGLGWAIAIGLLITVLESLYSSRAGEIQELVRSGRALFLYPITLTLMMVLPGFTEEFFFRGFLQTRLEVLVGSRWVAMLVATVLFGLYHLPYAYLNPMWPSAGDWGAAWRAALGNGIPGGLLIGTLYVLTKRNLVACMIVHSMINAVWAMTLINVSSG